MFILMCIPFYHNSTYVYHMSEYVNRVAHRSRCGTYLGCFGRWRLRSRTPGPPPFSSMNSTPANFKARRTARSLAAIIDASLSDNSARVVFRLLPLSLFDRSLHRRYGCLKRRKFILNKFQNHFDGNGVIFVPKYVPDAGDAAPSDVWMHSL